MEKPCLNDKNEYPDDAVLTRSLGDAKNAWDSFMELLQKTYPSITGEWRYYNDGKSWLFKITKKKKTICWVSVYHEQFKATFYFGDNAENIINNSSLKTEFIEQFTTGKRYGKIRGITVVLENDSELDTIATLIEIKEQLK